MIFLLLLITYVFVFVIRLKKLIDSTRVFVHYLGWNARYDEWLMLHKIRVDEKVVHFYN